MGNLISGNAVETISAASLKAERERKLEEARVSGLFARIRKDSEYAGQDDSAFPVAVYADGDYIVHGGRGGRYRLADVDLFWPNAEGKLIPIKKCK